MAQKIKEDQRGSATSAVREPRVHTFDTIRGHQATIRYLENAIDNRLLPHALLITGPRGIGRTSLSYALVKRLCCPHGAPPECPCRACRQIRSGISPDLLLIEPESASGQLTLRGWKPGKDDPDDLQYYRFVEAPPIENPFKVLVFRQAERMNIALSNYLLKLIEEPPSYLIIVLLAPRLTDVLSTIRSRCAPLVLSPVDYEAMSAFALAVAPQLSDSERHMLVALSEGRPGRLLELLEMEAEQEHAKLAREMTLFREHGFLALFATARRLAHLADGHEQHATERFRVTLDALLAWMRDAVILKTLDGSSASPLLLYRDVLPQLQSFAAATSLEGLLQAARHIPGAYDYVLRMTDRYYVLEILLTRMGRAFRAS